jgi:hypothetical protein
MPAPDSVLKLCETFAEHREHFRSGNYNEFQLRKQFLDPLFHRQIDRLVDDLYGLTEEEIALVEGA